MKFLIITLLLILTPGIVNAKISHESKVALRLHDYNKALKLLKSQAVRNNADAQYHLALLYRTGKGTKQNYKKAFYWFKRSADNGNLRSQYNCGILFENGYGVKANEKKALRWYKMAAKKGHSKSKAKLASGLSITKNASKNTASSLFNAIKNKKISQVKKLTRKCSKINKKNSDGDSPLTASIKYGNDAITKIILRCKPSLKTKDRNGNTPLLLATQNKKTNIVSMLSKRRSNAINTSSPKGLTPLMKSALLNDLKSAGYLLNKGAKVNLKDKKGKTAYSFARIKQHTEMMALLKKHGATYPRKNNKRIIANTKTKAGQWPLLITASWRGQDDVVEAILKKKTNPNRIDKDGNTALIRASERGHIKVVKTLIKHSASINKKNKKGFTALMAAASKNKTEILNYLIKKNAKINLRDKNGMSAIMHAADTGNLSSFVSLINHTANTRHKDKNKRTLIKISQDNNRQSITSYIIKNNTIRVSKADMQALLLNAAANGKIQTIKEISNKGVSLNITDKQGNTPLIISSGKGFYNTSNFLIRKKADVNAKNKHGNTALIFAAQTGKIKIVKLLLSSKANPSIRNKNRKTALDLAESNGFKQTAKLIQGADKSSNFLNLF